MLASIQHALSRNEDPNAAATSCIIHQWHPAQLSREGEGAPTENLLLEDTDGLLPSSPIEGSGGRSNQPATSRCSSLLRSANVHSSDDVIRIEVSPACSSEGKYPSVKSLMMALVSGSSYGRNGPFLNAEHDQCIARAHMCVYVCALYDPSVCQHSHVTWTLVTAFECKRAPRWDVAPAINAHSRRHPASCMMTCLYALKDPWLLITFSVLNI